MPPRCHVCSVRGHKRRECTACRYCGSTLHTTEHSVENARKKGWSEVAGTMRVEEFVMEEEENEAAEYLSKKEHQGNGSQPGSLTHMCRDSVFDSQGMGELVRERERVLTGIRRGIRGFRGRRKGRREGMRCRRDEVQEGEGGEGPWLKPKEKRRRKQGATEEPLPLRGEG